jgi:glycosyltransferase involved in cell wall biosynthesis
MKKLLIITYAFPPSNDVAIHRVLRFSKWLPQYGWEPVILTPHYTLTQRIDRDNLHFVEKYIKKVYRSSGFYEELISHIADKKNRNPFARFVRGYFLNRLTPDISIMWLSGAIKKGMDIIRNEKIDAIWATLGPPTAGLIGAELRRRTNAPLVIDYRDPWTLNPYRKYSEKQLSRNLSLEKSMLKEANAVITTSEAIRYITVENDYFDERRSFVVTNGMDEELQWMYDNTDQILLDSNKINITYVGSFYGDRQPYSFLEGLKLFIKEFPNYSNMISFNIIGNQDPENNIESYCRENGLLNIINQHGLVSYRKAMQYLRQSTILLLVNGINPQSDIFIPGKIFDYLVTSKPILFIGEGQPSNIIKDTSSGISVGHNPSDIANALHELIYKNRRTEVNKVKLQYYQAESVTKYLVKILNTMT